METKELFESLVIPVAEDPSKVNYEKCKRCAAKGKVCCQHLPCYLSPDNVKDKTFQGICALIDTGVISLDWWCGDPNLSEEENRTNVGAMSHRGYFLRMRGKNKPVVHPAIKPAECMMLTDTGCAFDYAYRPKGGRELVPTQDPYDYNGCTDGGYDKKACAREWHPYYSVLDKVYAKYYLQDKLGKYDTDAQYDMEMNSAMNMAVLFATLFGL